MMESRKITFMLLRDEGAILQAQQHFHLLYSDCLPASDNNGGVHAVVGDRDHTFLIVMQHNAPYCNSPVVVTALVVNATKGLRKLQSFLQHFTRTNRMGSQLTLGGPSMVLHMGEGIALADVIQALQSVRPPR